MMFELCGLDASPAVTNLPADPSVIFKHQVDGDHRRCGMTSQQIIETGSFPRPDLGIEWQAVTPYVALRYRLAVEFCQLERNAVLTSE